MKLSNLAATLLIGFLSVRFVAVAQESHDHMKGMVTPTKQTEKMSAKSALEPAQGAGKPVNRIVGPARGDRLERSA